MNMEKAKLSMTEKRVYNLKFSKILDSKVEDFKIQSLIYSLGGNLKSIKGQVKINSKWQPCNWDDYGEGAIKLDNETICINLVLIETLSDKENKE